MSTGADELFQAKVVLLGNANVGKSSIIQRYISNTFSDYSNPTLGATFLSKVIDFDKKTVKLNIWDTAGQERYNSLSITYCRNLNVCIFVYDITKKDSFEGIKRWYDRVKILFDDNTVLAVVGNKEDLIDQEEVRLMEAKYFANLIKASHYKISAMDGTGVSELFKEISQKLLGVDYLSVRETIKSSKVGSLLQSSHEKQKKKKCC